MKKTVPILILDNTSAFGGAINSLCYLLRALDKEQFEPVLLTGQAKEFLAEHFDCTCYHYVPSHAWQDNLFYRKISAIRLFRFRSLRKVLNLWSFLYWVAFITIPEAVKYFLLGRKHRVALVHLNNMFGCQIAGILAAKFLRVPCVAHLRDFEAVDLFTRFYARLIDHHVAISSAVRDNLRQLEVPDERITIVHDALDLADFQSEVDGSYLVEEFGLAPEQPTFGIFGRVVEWKGIREFILAVREVVEEIPEARAFVVGGHSDDDKGFFRSMQQLAVDLGVAGKVVFTGYRKDVSALMGLMDVIVHASTRPEPFGMVIIEGMAMKKPVVATRGGGPLDIVVDGETGLLVEMGDAEALGRAISTLLRQPELRRTMGLAGLARVSHQFTSRRYACQIASIYQHLGATV
ncbi:glycosyltransferase family 4 protein [Geobacter sp.]|uniref:glycosyltransferase family 4 protein n=1 Tax=Geobacter sp. TaxID=46610 RepID=UPI002604B46F|nr:glycosyltransferase family 4 protein [Geobacter sp.]